ncbi:universal stress protein [Silvibacterium acidisoli]|uniref:universal stress protein n=1 Tax=Acidobacteriaceae bacterium ZG23-2 TaxID=2883246 RepID=UPI00406C6DDF
MPSHRIEEQALKRYVHPEKILVATDLTGEESVIPYAIAQARASSSELVLVHALEPIETSESPYQLLTPQEQRAYRQQTIHDLEGLKNRLEAQGLRCSVRAISGSALNVIQEAVATEHSTRVIAATHGRKHLRELILGSVAKQLMATLPVPLFLVGPRGEAENLRPIQRILCPVSLEGDYQDIARFAFLLARENHAHITLMHVLEEEASGEMSAPRTLAWGRHALQTVANENGHLKEQLSIKVASGPALKAILNLAEKSKADVIVMGNREPFPTSRVRNCLAYKVAASAPCPVFSCRFDLAMPGRADVRHEPVHA